MREEISLINFGPLRLNAGNCPSVTRIFPLHRRTANQEIIGSKASGAASVVCVCVISPSEKLKSCAGESRECAGAQINIQFAPLIARRALQRDRPCLSTSLNREGDEGHTGAIRSRCRVYVLTIFALPSQVFEYILYT
jgi:hypothetical protein